jgi:hypothetical protein
VQLRLDRPTLLDQLVISRHVDTPGSVSQATLPRETITWRGEGFGPECISKCFFKTRSVYFINRGKKHKVLTNPLSRLPQTLLNTRPLRYSQIASLRPSPPPSASRLRYGFCSPTCHCSNIHQVAHVNVQRSHPPAALRIPPYSLSCAESRACKPSPTSPPRRRRR